MSPAIEPFTGPIPVHPDAVSKSPDYPESGVAYAAYFKKQIGQGKQETYRQNTFFIEVNSSTSTGLITSLPTFVTAIHIYWINMTAQSTNGDSVSLFNGVQGATGDEVWTHLVTNGTADLFHQTFPTALQFPQGIFFQNALTGGTTGRMRLQIWGWQE